MYVLNNKKDFLWGLFLFKWVIKVQGIIIRNATIEDVERIADIKIEGWQTAYRGIIDDDFIDNGVNIIVAELNKNVVGFCLYRNYNKNTGKYPEADCEISSLYITSKLKRNEIGKKLMKYVIELLRKEGKKQMIWGCLKENYPSRAFYESMGGKASKIKSKKFGEKEYELISYLYEL